jgi:hypothetical protein
MTEPPLLERHFPHVPEAVSRLDADVPEPVIFARAETAEVAGQLLGVEPERPKLVPSADGAVRRMLLTIPRWAVADIGGEPNPYGTAYRDLFAKLPEGLETVVLVHRSVAADVASWLADAGLGDRSNVVDADDFLGFSIWAEDGYVAVHDPGTDASALVEPAYFPRRGDALVADYVRHRARLGTYQAPLYFQGGNVLVGDDFFLIGIDYPIRTLNAGIVHPRARPVAGRALARAVQALPRRGALTDFRGQHPGCAAGPGEADHDERGAVDGVRLPGQRPGHPPAALPHRHVHLAGRARGGRSLPPHGRRPPRGGHPDRRAPEAGGDAGGLRQHRGTARPKRIRRDPHPLPLTYVDDSETRQRAWYFATGNNALVHRPADGRNMVLIPSYGHGPYSHLEATDARNREIWEELGFEVRLLGDFHPFAQGLGAVHCIKKYLARGPALPRPETSRRG